MPDRNASYSVQPVTFVKPFTKRTEVPFAEQMRQYPMIGRTGGGRLRMGCCMLGWDRGAAGEALRPAEAQLADPGGEAPS